jgi:hypothetical protein
VSKDSSTKDFDASLYAGPIPPLPDDLDFIDRIKLQDRIRWAFANGCPAIIFNWAQGNRCNIDSLALWESERKAQRRTSTNGEIPDTVKGRYALNALHGRGDDLSALNRMPKGKGTRDGDTKTAIWYLAGFYNDDYLTEAQIIDEIVDCSRNNGHIPDNKSVAQVEDDVRRGLKKSTHGFKWDEVPWYATEDTQPTSVSKVKAETNGEAAEFEDEPTTWEPVDLGPCLCGEKTQPKPSLGMPRRDGVHLIYPGREHVVLGDTESGKSWFALGCVVAELLKGNMVVYIHYEEPDETSTIERLLLLGLDADTIKAQLKFIGPMRPIRKDWLKPLVALKPSLVVHDGVNEAMSLQGAGQDVDGASLFRRLLVTPFTRTGAATLACDHLPMVKDSSRRDAYGTVHKGNALDGARIQLENFKEFGRGRRCVSNVFVTKDRPGYLREHGKPTDTPGRTFMGCLVVDDMTEQPEFLMRFYAPRDDDDDDDQKQTFTLEDVGNIVHDVIYAQPDHTVESLRKLYAAMRQSGQGFRENAIRKAVDDLVLAGRCDEVSGRRGATGYRAKSPAAHTPKGEDE